MHLSIQTRIDQKFLKNFSKSSKCDDITNHYQLTLNTHYSCPNEIESQTYTHLLLIYAFNRYLAPTNRSANDTKGSGQFGPISAYVAAYKWKSFMEYAFLDFRMWGK
eukprot:5810_1